jgi:hypothetical protein
MARPVRPRRCLTWRDAAAWNMEFDPERNVRDGYVEPPVPTHHAPGTPGKIEELAKRYKNNQPLWVDGDCEESDGESIKPTGKAVRGIYVKKEFKVPGFLRPIVERISDDGDDHDG